MIDSDSEGGSHLHLSQFFIVVSALIIQIYQ